MLPMVVLVVLFLLWLRGAEGASYRQSPSSGPNRYVRDANAPFARVVTRNAKSSDHSSSQFLDN